MLIFYFATTFRLGEATTPGPVLGNLNPTGLMGKASEIASLPHGVYTFQESHLTSQGIRKFKQELQWSKSGYQLSHGHPAPPKNDSLRTIGGKHTGTGVLSAYPCRPLDHHWSPEQYQTGRCHIAAAYVQTRWITCGTVYGYSERSHCLDVQQSTGLLLDGLTSKVVEGSHGLRIITGDWNQERQNLHQADYWEAKGWMEAQQFALQRWSVPPIATCRRTTIKDYVFLSPEIQPYVCDVQLDWSRFSDHAVIQVHLTDLGRPALVPMWRKPSAIDWPTKPQHVVHWPHQAEYSENTDEWCRNIWHNVERYASALCQANDRPQLALCQTGRASTTEVKWTQEQIAPIRNNRKGDIQSAITTGSMQYSRWTRQIRRLQHYTRCADSASTPTVDLHRASLWGKIIQAPGFQGGFRMWWAQLPKTLFDTPAMLPSMPPPKLVANAIFLEFCNVYKALENSLVNAKAIHASQRRIKDPLQIYRDLQRERAEPVQTIVVEETLQVTNTNTNDDSTVTITLDHDLPMGLHSIPIQGVETQVQVCDTKQLRVPASVAESIADQVVVRKVEAEIPAVLQAFEREWAPRWQKHDSINSDHWDAIVGFMQHALPERHAIFPPITAKMLTKAVASKRKFAAVGPDGISKRDMLNMPPCSLEDLVLLIQTLENGAPWPSQAVTGLVSALAKVPSAQKVQQYRPICIFGMFYRAWGSIRARQCLQYLATLVPATVMGNIPGRSPQKIWFHVQQLIEHSYCQVGEVAGSVIDIVKCFNALPRSPLLKIARLLGIPTCVLIPWENALKGMRRRFQVRSCVGQAIDSSTGFPEGCALSVVSMAICNITMELWMFFRFPSVRLWSFVDNIECTTESAETAIHALQGLIEFCDLMDLSIDQSKTYLWSTSPTGRKMILDSQNNRKFFARDLGGHMNYSKKRTNVTVQDKIREFSPFWTRLARSCAPVSQKERALKVSAWPNIFYGVSTITLGANHYQRLRSQCTRALNTNQTGANPDLQLACISPPMTDPEMYGVVNTIMAMRNHCDPDLTQFTLQFLTAGNTSSQGPCQSFLTAIHKLAWSWENGDRCIDQDGLPVDIFRCTKPELRQRIVLSWQQRVLETTEAMRSTMKGLSQTDVRMTAKSMKTLPDEHKGLLRCALNGTQYTNDALCHAGVVDTSQCRFCQSRDSIYHRTWECPYFQDLRDQMPQLPKPEEHTLATACHGWLPRSPDLNSLRELFLQFPDTTSVFAQPQLATGLHFTDLFLDGSCAYPTEPDLRMASWAYVVWDGNDFQLVANGMVQGWRQTSLRAEITSAISALKFCVDQPLPCRLWFDNESVQTMLSQWIQGFEPPYQHKQDADLWHMLHVQFQHARPFVVASHKVQAHTKHALQETVLDEWAVKGNAMADMFAEEARQHLTPAFWQTWRAVQQHQSNTWTFGKALHKLLVQIGIRAQASTIVTGVPGPQVQEQSDVMTIDPGILALSLRQVGDFPKHLQVEETPHILRWLQSIVDPQQSISWVSYHQLLVDYQFFSQRQGPFTTGRKWTDRRVDHVYNYPQQVQWFGRYIQNMAKANKEPLHTDQRRPSSSTLAFWCGCLRVAIPNQRLSSIDHFYKKGAKHLPIRQIVRDMADLPVVS